MKLLFNILLAFLVAMLPTFMLVCKWKLLGNRLEKIFRVIAKGISFLILIYVIMVIGATWDRLFTFYGVCALIWGLLAWAVFDYLTKENKFFIEGKSGQTILSWKVVAINFINVLLLLILNMNSLK